MDEFAVELQKLINHYFIIGNQPRQSMLVSELKELVSRHFPTVDKAKQKVDFGDRYQDELKDWVCRWCLGRKLNTSDSVVAEYLLDCLDCFGKAMTALKSE